jgi:MDMPI C-terminal domain./Mycothiol maleylpyruvate isomerase N-terminal domain.
VAAFYDRASHDLADILAATPPDTPAWTWSEDQTVGFIRRRQAHEALIHRVDAELTAGRRTPMDPGLSADGVDEALRVMYGGVPPWGSFTPTGAGTLRLRASDTGNTWLVTTGRLPAPTPATAPATTNPTSTPLTATPVNRPPPTVVGTAADLDCWLWHRPEYTPVTTSGDPPGPRSLPVGHRTRDRLNRRGRAATPQQTTTSLKRSLD